MLKFKKPWSVTITAMVAILIAVNFALAIECNKKPFGPVQACNHGWASAVYCSHWGKNNCSGQQGAAPGNPGANIMVGCGEVPEDPEDQNPANHCIDDPTPMNCLPKFYCQYVRNQGCKAINPVTNSQGQVWLTEEQTTTESCTPHG